MTRSDGGRFTEQLSLELRVLGTRVMVLVEAVRGPLVRVADGGVGTVARDGQREVEVEVEVEDGRWKMEDGGDLPKGPGAGSEFLQVAAIWASDPRAEMVSD